MFKELFKYELMLWLKRPGVYIYFAIFFLLAFLLGAAISGMFGGVTSDTNSHINSSVVIAGILTSFSSDYLFGLITLLICVALMAGSVQRDFQYNTFSFYFTKPISKFNYLAGRFSASFLLTVFVLTGIMLGIWLAFAIAPNDNGQLGPFLFLNFFQPFLYFLVPNTFFVGTLFFCLVTFSRNMTSGYVGSLVFIVIAGVARSSISNIDNKAIASLLDPFGSEALDAVTDYWTPAETNSRLIPFSGYVAYNRLLWLGISAALLVFTYYRFSFSQFLNPVSLFKRKARQNQASPSALIRSIGHLPKVMQRFDVGFSMRQLAFLIRFEFLKITKSVFFIIVVGLSILLTVLTAQFSGLFYGTELYPVTYRQIELSGGTFFFFQLILLVFYSGIVIWRERDSKVDELVGSTPVKSAVLFLSKFLSLLFLCLAINVVCIITCIVIQAVNGYTHFEPVLYFTDLFLLKIAGICLFAALGMSVQVFFKNRYFAFFTMVFIFLGIPLIVSKVMKYDNALVEFNSSGDLMRYSDMNGHGHTLPNYFIYKGYWIGLMLMVGALATAMYQRGKEQSFRLRLKVALRNFGRPYKLVALLGLVLFLGCGFVAYYNRSVINTYKSPGQQEEERAQFEINYKKYLAEPQPRVVASSVNVDIFPDELGCKLKGFYYLKNKHGQALSNIFINLPSEVTIKNLGFDVASTRFLKDSANGFFGYTLNKALLPNDSIRLLFELSYFPRNFIMRKRQTEIIQNGTFFNNGYLPSIGYNPQAELSDNSARKKYHLAAKPRMAPVTDSAARQNTYISNDGDWIRFECVVSTKEGQIAVAPGYLLKEWRKKGRHYFQYKMDAPILNFYAFLSANYQVKRDAWIHPGDNKKVNIEIYYHQGHEYNLDRMVKSIKKSLDYFTKNFSPYQHRQVRILEFPRYETFAQSFPNTIPFSEAIGFIAKVNDNNPDEVDYPFYVTAHEVAHQWWAHQVIGANTQGSTLMSETMAQYSALMVMEKEYGQAAMSKFLRYEMNHYLQGRSTEGKKEVPLLKCENQQYIHYNKGSMVMYALKDYLGEDTLNAALAKYIRKTAFQEPPFTIAPEFYDYIKHVTPDSLKETVKDLFERIVVYDNGIKNWSMKKTATGKYQVTATIHGHKTSSDSLGKAKEVKLHDWMDLGVFVKNEKNPKTPGEAIYFKKIKVTSADQRIEVIVDRPPYMVGIDPYNKLIDKNTADNLKDVNGKDAGQGGDVTSGITVSAD